MGFEKKNGLGNRIRTLRTLQATYECFHLLLLTSLNRLIQKNSHHLANQLELILVKPIDHFEDGCFLFLS